MFSLLAALTMMRTTMAFSGRLETMAPHSRKSHMFLSNILKKNDAKILVYWHGRHLVNKGDGTINWQHTEVLQAMNVKLEEEGEGEGKGIGGQSSADAVVVRAVALLENAVAVDFSSFPEETVYSKTTGGGSLVGTRELMAFGTAEALATVGRAGALLTWHSNNVFCGACGATTVSLEGGAKRACSKCNRRFYPRVDPVMIALVEDASNDSILLGRSSKYRPGMFSCLSGFIEPGETVEEAVRREVFEEAGIVVESVDQWSSQPWPVGRAGGCELMLACVAKTRHPAEIIRVDVNEMEDVRWFTREQVQSAYEASSRYASGAPPPPLSTAEGDEEREVWIPGEYAIAHHLIKYWLSKK